MVLLCEFIKHSYQVVSECTIVAPYILQCASFQSSHFVRAVLMIKQRYLYVAGKSFTSHRPFLSFVFPLQFSVISQDWKMSGVAATSRHRRRRHKAKWNIFRFSCFESSQVRMILRSHSFFAVNTSYIGNKGLS